MLQRIEVGQ